jgi:hypothetical protein
LAEFIPDGVREAHLSEVKDIRVMRGRQARHISLKFLFGGSPGERNVSMAK